MAQWNSTNTYAVSKILTPYFSGLIHCTEAFRLFSGVIVPHGDVEHELRCGRGIAPNWIGRCSKWSRPQLYQQWHNRGCLLRDVGCGQSSMQDEQPISEFCVYREYLILRSFDGLMWSCLCSVDCIRPAHSRQLQLFMMGVACIRV